MILVYLLGIYIYHDQKNPDIHTKKKPENDPYNNYVYIFKWRLFHFFLLEIVHLNKSFLTFLNKLYKNK